MVMAQLGACMHQHRHQSAETLLQSCIAIDVDDIHGEAILAAQGSQRGEYGFAVDVVDVDSDAALEQRFGTLVPVLMHAGTELCHYHLDAGKVRAYLVKIRENTACYS